MKKRIYKIILVLVCVFSLTGCTKYVKVDNKVVQNKTTGLNLTKNILCKPTDSETLKLYEENKVNIEKLPACEKMGVISSNYDGLWTTIFVQPLAWLIIQIGKLVKNYGLAIILSTLLIRGIMYPFTKKTAMQSENMKLAQPELTKLEKKYVAVCYGKVKEKEELRDYLFKDKKQNISYVTTKDKGKLSILDYSLIKYKNNFSLVDISLKTGRAHQIRVQFSSRKHPLVGDVKYGLNTEKIPVALFAYKLAFYHPISREKMKFELEIPKRYPFNMF